MERYKLLYELSRKALDEELDRYKKLDEKAGRFLNILSISIVGYTALINASSQRIFPLEAGKISSWIFTGLALLTFLALFSSWIRLFNAIKLSKSPRISIDQEVNSLIETEELITVYYSLSLSCQEALSAARDILKTKTTILESAYSEIRFSAYLLCASLAVYFLILFTTPGGPMTDTPKTPPVKPAEQAKPNPAATRPKVVMVLDHVIPVQRKK
ncbi:hypothetical protein [Pseudomonas sp. BRM28]|uniref:hypothetical protein n=1 Tax=Pseudomonas sp. BRM28 TaxID=2045201 RepID=UPI0011B0E9A2|nr:hypothetical protein [Pseudomonas sp. BRM28]